MNDIMQNDIPQNEARQNTIYTDNFALKIHTKYIKRSLNSD